MEQPDPRLIGEGQSDPAFLPLEPDGLEAPAGPARVEFAGQRGGENRVEYDGHVGFRLASGRCIGFLYLYSSDHATYPSSQARQPMHPVIEAAGRRGDFPDWAELTDYRRAHVERVAALLVRWGETLGLSEEEQVRWRAAGRLHDALKDAPTPELRNLVDDDSWPESVLHGPAVAARLADEGVVDDEFLLAVAYHSVGHPSFGSLGEHLYLADYLEPGRPEEEDRRELREAMPGGRADVLRRVIRRRIEHQLVEAQPVLPTAIGLWNRVVGP